MKVSLSAVTGKRLQVTGKGYKVKMSRNNLFGNRQINCVDLHFYPFLARSSSKLAIYNPVLIGL